MGRRAWRDCSILSVTNSLAGKSFQTLVPYPACMQCSLCCWCEVLPFESNMREIIKQPWVGRSILARYSSRPEDAHRAVPQLIKGRFMEKLSAEDAQEARRLAEQLGLRKLSESDLVKLLNAARVAEMRRGALDISGLTPADEPALVLRLPATGQSL